MKDLDFSKEKVCFEKDEVIFKENEEGKEMFFIDSGSVKIVKKVGESEETLVELGPDDFFGEMSLITGNGRVASAIALTECKLNVMDKSSFDANLVNDKEFKTKMINTLAHRLENTVILLAEHLQGIFSLSDAFRTSR